MDAPVESDVTLPILGGRGHVQSTKATPRLDGAKAAPEGDRQEGRKCQPVPVQQGVDLVDDLDRHACTRDLDLRPSRQGEGLNPSLDVKNSAPLELGAGGAAVQS